MPITTVTIRIYKLLRALLLPCFFLVVYTNCYADSQEVYFVASQKTDTTTEIFRELKLLMGKSPLHFVDLENSSFTPKNKESVIVTAGNTALDKILSSKFSNPIIATFISRISFRKVLEQHQYSSTPKHVTAIYTDPPIDRQLALIKAIYKKDVNVGVLVSSETQFLTNELYSAAKQQGLILNFIDIDKHRNLQRAINNLESSDVVLAFPDASIYNQESIIEILKSLYRKNIPIIGYNRSFVKAGGLATTYTDKHQIITTLADALKEYRNTGRLDVPENAKDFDISTNSYVARSLDIPFGEDDALLNEIHQHLGSMQ